MTSGIERLEHHRRLLVALVVAVVALVVGIGVGVDAHASTAGGQVAGTRVAAHEQLTGPVVAASQDVLAGERRAIAPDYDQTAVGSSVAAETEGAVLNSAGRAYPEVLNPGTGEPIPYPGEGLTRVPVSERVTWGAQERGAFIKEWYDRGFSTPEGGWSNYDIHHIIPREYGGTNVFDNLVPVARGVHQSEFNAWWRDY